MFAERYGAGLIVAAMLALAILAFGIPLFAVRDLPQDVPAITIRQLKVEARHMTKLPIVFQQVTAANTTGTPPITGAEGIVTWHTLFGVPVAEIHITRRSTARRGGMGSALLVPAAFVGAEVALAWLLVRRYF